MSTVNANRREEMFTVVESYYRSGLSQPTFCRQQGLNKSTFLYWLKKYRKEKEGRFLPLSINESKTTFNLDLELPNGIKIHIEG